MIVYAQMHYYHLDQNEMPSSTVNNFACELDHLSFDYHRYGHHYLEELREQIAKKHDVSLEQVTLTPGADGALDLHFKYCSQNKIAIYLPKYSYPGFKKIAEQQNSQIHFYNASSDDDINVINSISKKQEVALVLCHPENPSGFIRTNWQQRLQKFRGLLIVDEAYIDYSLENSLLSLITQRSDSTSIIRTFSKAYGAAAIRSAYTITSKKFSIKIQDLQLPFPISTLSAKISSDLLYQENEVQLKVSEQRQECLQLIKSLKKMGFTCSQSSTNFFIIKSCPFATLDDVYKHLMNKGLITRQVQTSPEQELSIRVTASGSFINNLLIDTLHNFKGVQYQ
jgi:histidinol-phosphate aminotransferase